MKNMKALSLRSLGKRRMKSRNDLKSLSKIELFLKILRHIQMQKWHRKVNDEVWSEAQPSLDPFP